MPLCNQTEGINEQAEIKKEATMSFQSATEFIQEAAVSIQAATKSIQEAPKSIQDAAMLIQEVTMSIQEVTMSIQEAADCEKKLTVKQNIRAKFGHEPSDINRTKFQNL